MKADLVCDTECSSGQKPKMKTKTNKKIIKGICRKEVGGKIIFHTALFICLIGTLFGGYWPVRAVLF